MIQPKFRIFATHFVLLGRNDMHELILEWTCVSPMTARIYGYGATPYEAYEDMLRNCPTYDPLLTHP